MSKYLFPFALLLSDCAQLSTAAQNCPNVKLPCARQHALAVIPPEETVLLETAKAAAARFGRVFDQAVPNTVIVSGGRIAPDLASELTVNGFATRLPWLDAEARSRMKAAALRKQVDAQTADLPETIRETVRARLLAQLEMHDMSIDRTVERGALSHELGHMWFIASYEASGAPATGHAYGGWAPDWLDETAAVLLENAALKERRRLRFAKMGPDRRFPLAEFLTMEHPSAQAVKVLNARSEAAPSPAGSSVRVLSGAEADAFVKASGGDRAADFYAQVLVFSDYLTDRAGGTAVFPQIAQALADGDTMQTWLPGNGFGLPSTVSALEADWAAWLPRRL